MNRAAAVAPIIPVPQIIGKDSAQERPSAFAGLSESALTGPLATLSSSIKSAAVSNSVSSMWAMPKAFATKSSGVACVQSEARGLRPLASIAK